MKRIRVSRAAIWVFKTLVWLALVPGVVLADAAPKWSDYQLATSSRLILTGQVLRVESGWDNDVAAIYTYVTVAVNEVLKGVSVTGPIVLKQLGGRVGDTGLWVPGQPQFVAGENVLLFLEVRPRDQTLYTASFWQGKWTIVLDHESGQEIAIRSPFGGQDYRAAVSDVRPLATFLDRLRRFAARSQSNAPGEPPVNFVPVETPNGGHPGNPIPSSRSPISDYVLFDGRWHEADSNKKITVEMQRRGQPGLYLGGRSQINKGRRLWNKTKSHLRLRKAKKKSWAPRQGCLGANKRDRIIRVTFNDPCFEIDNSGRILAYAYIWWGEPRRYVLGRPFWGITSGKIVTNDSSFARSWLSKSRCFEWIMAHEFGLTPFRWTPNL